MRPDLAARRSAPDVKKRRFWRRESFRMGEQDRAPPARREGGSAVDAFVEAAKRAPAPISSGRGRLIFALDATMSRQPTWDTAQALQGRMFEAAARLGGLDV
jgi:hypothetical protein